MRQRILIVDFDFFASIGGGQRLYRRMVERNASYDFFYPSRGPDLRLLKDGKLPSNAFPFLYDSWLDLPLQDNLPADGSDWVHKHYLQQMAGVLVPMQGMTFQAVDIPSFFPAAHVIRPLLVALGIVAEKIVLGLVGWPSVSAKNAYDDTPQSTIDALVRAEHASFEAADLRYTISNLEQDGNSAADLPIQLVDMHNAIEWFPPPEPHPPGEGPPDIWFVGRLDGAKGPDLFIDLVSRMPRHLYRECHFSGPDNTWSPEGLRWSEYLLNLAKQKRVTAFYEGVMDDAEIRSRVYRGRTVLVIPSRNDAFNFVALEGVLNACPLLLSEEAGAAGFLRTTHPHLLPSTMYPSQIDAAAEALEQLLSNYQQVAERTRQVLRKAPFPVPEPDFMREVYRAQNISLSCWREQANSKAPLALNRKLALSPALQDWYPARTGVPNPLVTVIVPVWKDPEQLALTLSCLARQTFASMEVTVIDGAPPELSDEVRRLTWLFGSMCRLFRELRPSIGKLLERGLRSAAGEFVAAFWPGDVWGPDYLSEAVGVLRDNPNSAGSSAAWHFIDRAGYRLSEEGQKSSATLPDPGITLRQVALKNIRSATGPLSALELWKRAVEQGPLVKLADKLAYRKADSSPEPMQMEESPPDIQTPVRNLSLTHPWPEALATNVPAQLEVSSAGIPSDTYALAEWNGCCLVSDIPPSEDCPTGRLLNHMYLSAGQGWRSGFIALSAGVQPCLSQAALSMDLTTVYKPKERYDPDEPAHVVRESEQRAAQQVLSNLLPALMRHAHQAKASSFWFLLEGQTMVRLAHELLQVTSLPVYVQVADPPSTWLSANRVDETSGSELHAQYETVLRKAAGCAAASDEMAERYRREFKIPCVPLHKPLPASLRQPPALMKSSIFRFHIGVADRLDASGEWEQLLRVLDSVDWRIAGINMEVHTFTPNRVPPSSKRRLVARNWIDSAEELVKTLSELDLLYLPYPFAPEKMEEASLRFPSKLTSYLASGRPVLLHAPPYSVPARFVEKHKAAFICDNPSDHELLALLTRIVSSPADYRQIAANGRSAFDQHLTYDTLRESILAVFSNAREPVFQLAGRL